MIKCQACGTQNLDASQYCDECGDALIKYEAPVDQPIPPDPGATSIAEPVVENPLFRPANATSVGAPFNEAEENDDSQVQEDSLEAETAGVEVDHFKPQGVHANLVIERGQAIGTEFPLAADESNIGRWDADNGVFPDIDLDAHDAEAKVSRKHARILLRNGVYTVEDLGSTNGTFVNRGRRLIPGNAQVLNDGDELIVGKTFLRFQVVK